VYALRDEPSADLFTDSGELYLRRNTIAELRFVAARGRRPGGVAESDQDVVIRRRNEFPGDHRLVVTRTALDDEQRQRLFRIPAWPDVDHARE
jgi:hypothetical protein